MSVSTTQINPKTEDATIYLDRMTSLELSLTNDGETITVNSGSNASILKIYLPDFFSPNDLNIMTIEKTDWEFASFIDESNINNCYLSLTYSGADYDWNIGEALIFTIERVYVLQTTKELPYDGGATQINFENFVNLSTFTPSIPEVNLTLDNPPAAQADLKAVLQVFLSYEGIIHVSSDADDLLNNTLYLNFENIGTDALSMSSQTNGTVEVSFVFGNTSGALTSLDNGWNINAEVDNQEGNDWIATNPDKSSTDPTWTLNPGDAEVIGTGKDANVIFRFNNIVSFVGNNNAYTSSAYTGNTQMIVSFSNFMKDEATPYDDATYVLDIKKLDTPRLRGLTSFYVDGIDATAAAAALRYKVANPQDEITVPVSWGMYYVEKVQIVANVSDQVLYTKTYDNEEPITTDGTDLTLSGMKYSDNVSITAQAFDGTGALLNSIEFTVYVESSYIQTQVAQELATIRQKISQLSQAMSGLLRFYCKSEKITYDINNVKNYPDTNTSNQVELVLWTHGVSYVQLFTNYSSPTIDSTSTDPSTDPPTDPPTNQIYCVDTTLEQNANTATVTLPILNTDPITIIAQAYDSSGNLLNTMECTVFVEIPYIDQKGTSYPTVQIGNLLWMTENLDWDSGNSGSFESYPANDTYAKDNKLGKLYSPYYAASYAQPGWRLPAPSNWQDLFDLYGSQSNGSCIKPDTYNAFLDKDGGASGLNIQLGGYYTYPKINDEASVGCYASSYLPGSSVNGTVVFNSSLRTTSISNTSGYGCVSVRFVREIPFVQIQKDDKEDNQ